MDDLVAKQEKIKGNGSFSIDDHKDDHSTNWARILSRLTDLRKLSRNQIRNGLEMKNCQN
jgi:hypothetical protein